MKIAGALIVCLVASAGAASELGDYLKLRSTHGVKQKVGLETLNTFVGTRVLEVSGTIKGSVRFGDSGTLMLETAEGFPIPIQTQVIPDWMLQETPKARLLIRASRAHESANLEAELLASISEGLIASYEAKNQPAVKPRLTTRTPSRGSSTPRPMPGTLKPTSQPAARDWNLPASDAVPYYSAYIQNYNKRLTKSQADRIAEGVVGFSIQYGVDARLVMALLIAESGFNPNARSGVGAIGLGQLMPGTARELGVSNAYDTMENLYGTVRLLSKHIDSYTAKTGDDFEGLVLALAAYNAGPGAVRKHGGVPPYRETQNYVRKVVSLYRQLCGEKA